MVDLAQPDGWLDLFAGHTTQHTRRDFYNAVGMPPETLPVCVISLPYTEHNSTYGQ